MKNLKVFTDNIEGKALNQVHELMKQESFANEKVRIMPDVHAGAGCVIGFTSTMGERVIPNIVGVDIGCGMYTLNLGNIDIDFKFLDQIINVFVPSGGNVFDKEQKLGINLKELKMYKFMRNESRIKQSLGTLGGGNHFIEVDVDKEGNKYLVIHTGSRNLGLQVAKFYQDLAIKTLNSVSETQKKEVIERLLSQNRQSEIQDALKALTPPVKVPKELAYLEGENAKAYLHDMRMAQKFALDNRVAIAEAICGRMGWRVQHEFQTIHNYIGDDQIIRKGAISARFGEVVLIPISMRDGCILARGKGNADWNYSAPHGAGRIMSRTEAKEVLDLEQFKDDMKDVFTTSVGRSTIDESPRAYKQMDEILRNIEDTVDVMKILKPLYNFKASE